MATDGLAAASERELAELVAEAWAQKGYRTTTKERQSTCFVFGKRRDGGGEKLVVWVAGDRSVGESHLRTLDSFAENVGATDVRCLTVGQGRLVASETADELDIDHLDGDDLRADPDVEVPGRAGDEHPGGADSAGSTVDPADPAPTDDRGTTDAGAGPVSEPGRNGDTDPAGEPAETAPTSPSDGSNPGEASAANPEDDDGGGTGADGGPGAGAVGTVADRSDRDESSESGDATRSVADTTGAETASGQSGAARDRGELWDGWTTGPDASTFSGAWDDVTDNGAVTDGSDPDLWDETTE